MKKNLAKLAFASLLSVVSLASCAGSGQGNATNPMEGVDWEALKTGENGKTTVTLWTTIGQQNQDIFNQMIAAFESEYKGVEINHVTKGGYDTLFSDAQTAIPAGTNPTMAYCYSDHVASYLNANFAVQDMTPYMTDENVGLGVGDTQFNGNDNGTAQSDFVQGYLEDGHNYIIDNERLSGYYSLPYTRSSEVLVYNKTFFEAHNLDVNKLSTWKGVFELCKTIMDNKWLTIPAAQFGKVAPLGYDSSDNMFITMCQQLGIPYTDGTQENPLSFYNARNQGGKSLLEQLCKYYDAGYFMTQDTAGGYTSSAFYNQQCFMTISSTAGINHCVPAADASGEAPFEVGVAPLPTMNDGSFVEGLEVNTDLAKTDAVISQGPSMCFFSRATNMEKAAAWLFYKYTSGSYWNAVWAGETGYEPVRTSAYDQQAFKDNTVVSDADTNQVKRQKEANAAVHNLVRTYGDTARLFTSDVFVGSAQARVAVGDLLSGALTHEGELTDAALDDLYYQYFNDAAQALPQA